MADYDNRLVRGATTIADTMDTGLRAHMLRVYNYMVGALALTGGVAWFTAHSPLLNLLYHQVVTANGVALAPTTLGWVATFAPLALVFLLQFRFQSMSLGAVQATFWSYAALLGISLSFILLLYTGASVAMTFFVTAATFGSMSLWGYTTKRDLTGIGNFLIMGMWGVFIAIIANMFFKSPAIDFVVSVLGVVIFTGLTAFNTQQIKTIYYANLGQEMTAKYGVLGALMLYADFVNIFLFLLRFLGNRR